MNFLCTQGSILKIDGSTKNETQEVTIYISTKGTFDNYEKKVIVNKVLNIETSRFNVLPTIETQMNSTKNDSSIIVEKSNSTSLDSNSSTNSPSNSSENEANETNSLS